MRLYKTRPQVVEVTELPPVALHEGKVYRVVGSGKDIIVNQVELERDYEPVLEH